ncbi:glycosyltransferase [Candidatus Pelagibacter sp.]|nr:glycosyltransferase [Candidatus Pelagibacter sp.]
MKNISFIFPVYNEENRLNNIFSFIKWIKKNKIKNYEIVIISNGSIDKTVKILKDYSKKNKLIRYYHISKASRGAAIITGIKKSKFELNAICAIDNAWDLDFYPQAFKILKTTNFAVVFGPKTHIYSKINRPFIRRIISTICTLYLKLLFGDKIDQDTQCIKFFNKKKIKILKYLSKRNLFFDAEFFLLIRMLKIKYLSIPVKVRDNKKMISIKMMLKFLYDALTFRFSSNFRKVISLNKKQ